MAVDIGRFFLFVGAGPKLCTHNFPPNSKWFWYVWMKSFKTFPLILLQKYLSNIRSISRYDTQFLARDAVECRGWHLRLNSIDCFMLVRLEKIFKWSCLYRRIEFKIYQMERLYGSERTIIFDFAQLVSSCVGGPIRRFLSIFSLFCQSFAVGSVLPKNFIKFAWKYCPESFEWNIWQTVIFPHYNSVQTPARRVFSHAHVFHR